MVSVPSALVLLLTCIVLASGQRKVSRNTQVSEEIKPEINFQCPEEFGYYPHPSDCTLYHVCFFGRPVLESCTGGLMYSPELQTCDWPRNVGCDGTGEVSIAAIVSSSNSPSSISTESRTRYTASPKSLSHLSSQPSVIVTPRGQPRSLHHSQDIVKQQRYYDQDEDIPEQIAVVERQRTYRGQPAKVSDVQRDRDGLGPYGDNSIPSYSSRGEKIGVISFGTGQQQSNNPSYSITDINDVLTNDLKLVRRRKRQIQRSDRDVTPWHGSGSDKRSYQTRQNPRTIFLLPPPSPTQHYNTNFQPQFLPIAQQDDGFKPFFPNYNVNPIYSQQKSSEIYKPQTPKIKENYYFVNPPASSVNKPAALSDGRVILYNRGKENVGSTLTQSYVNHQPITSKPKPIKEDPKMSGTVVNFSLVHDEDNPRSNRDNTASKRYTESKYSSPYDSGGYGYDSNEGSSTTNDYDEFEKNSKRYFHSKIPDLLPYQKNNYEYVNPFSSSTFNFDDFFKDFDSYHYGNDDDDDYNANNEKSSTTTTTEVVQTTPKAHIEKITQKVKTTTPSDYYYYDDYDETEKPKTKYTTKATNTETSTAKYIKSTTSKDDQYYYDDDYEYDNVPTEEPKKVIHKIKEPPLQIIESTTKKNITTKPPPTTTFKIITSTTTPLPPAYTIRQRIKTTIKTTIRPTQINNRQKILTTTDSDLRPDDLTTSRIEEASIIPQKAISSTTNKALYNGSRHYESTHYDPYYFYDDVELYRDDDYPQQYNSNNGGRQHTQNGYRGTPAAPTQVLPTSEEIPKRRPAFQEHTYIPQDIYQPTVSEYSDDGYVDDQSSYIRQPNRQSSNLRGDRNDINYIEEPSTTKRTTTTIRTTTTTTTTTTTPRPIPIQKSTVPSSRSPVSSKANQTRALLYPNTLPEDRRQVLSNDTISPLSKVPPKIGLDSSSELTNLRQRTTDLVTNFGILENDSNNNGSVKNINPTLNVTQKPFSFHYITKASRSTPVKQTTNQLHDVTTETQKTFYRQRNRLHKVNNQVIMPTTYAPPKFFLKYILPKSVASSTTTSSDTLIPKAKFTTSTNTSLSYNNDHNTENSTIKNHRIIKTIRKFINPIAINNEFAGINNNDNNDASGENVFVENYFKNKTDQEVYSKENAVRNRLTSTVPTLSSIALITTTVKITTPITQKTTTTTPTTTSTTTTSTLTTTSRKPSTTTSAFSMDIDQIELTPSLPNLNYNEPNLYVAPNQKRFRTTVEIPRPEDLLDRDDLPKQKPDVYPSYKPKPIVKITQSDLLTNKTADVPRNTSIPARISRVNTAIKSLIALGGPRRPNAKSLDNQTRNVNYNDIKQRSNTRGRGNLHYSGGNADSIPVNRGTPPPRTRSTLKPSTSIISKVAEFVDIYKYPPRRPDPIYPQPVPDKAAAKCRRDVCLLPDCNCGGKEIPGDLPVEQLPQIVLLTFDDSVNDLNKGLYSDLFERGRVNPNGCPISATFYVSHEWTDYSQVQNLYSDGHEIASHTVSHSFGEQFSQKKWTKEVAGQREILAAYGGVKLEDVRGMRAPFLSVGGNKMFKMLYDSNFTYDSSMPIYENKPPSWPFTLDYKLFHDCMIPPCPTRSYPGVWEVPMVMWQDLNGGRCSMGDACSHPADAEGVVKLLKKNFQRHYTTNRAPFGLFYHAAYFTKDHHKEGFIQFLDYINSMKDVYLVTNWQAIQWVRDPTPLSRLSTFQPFQCNYSDRPKRCNNPKVCNLWHKSGVRYMRTCQPCPDIYPWTGNTGIRSSRIDNDIED